MTHKLRRSGQRPEEEDTPSCFLLILTSVDDVDAADGILCRVVGLNMAPRRPVASLWNFKKRLRSPSLSRAGKGSTLSRCSTTRNQNPFTRPTRLDPRPSQPEQRNTEFAAISVRFKCQDFRNRDDHLNSVKDSTSHSTQTEGTAELGEAKKTSRMSVIASGNDSMGAGPSSSPRWDSAQRSNRHAILREQSVKLLQALDRDQALSSISPSLRETTIETIRQAADKVNPADELSPHDVLEALSNLASFEEALDTVIHNFRPLLLDIFARWIGSSTTSAHDSECRLVCLSAVASLLPDLWR